MCVRTIHGVEVYLHDAEHLIERKMAVPTKSLTNRKMGNKELVDDKTIRGLCIRPFVIFHNYGTQSTLAPHSRSLSSPENGREYIRI